MIDRPMSDVPAVAIIGVAGRLPGASTIEDLWHNLREGVESVTFFDREELVASGVDRDLAARPEYVPARATLGDIELFDASFFGFGVRESELTDPQQRLFLEVAWEAFERAGYDPAGHEGPVGVWAGAAADLYLLRNLVSHPEIAATDGLLQVMTHNRTDHLSTRVAYKLDLRGPAVTVQTACSTSLVATALACQSLVGYQCDVALAGGSALSVPQTGGYLYQEGGIDSPDGHCRPYDHRAAGTIAGSGVAAVVLKRLEDALVDGDHVHAVIRGWAINNDGARKVGYTAPSIDHQAEVIAAAQALAGVEARSIGFVEGHGTGTPLGDPVEVEALARAFRLSTSERGFCALGSIKSNFGHLDTAAGVAGLIKAALALENRTIPPTVHFEKPNPRLGLEESPFYVNSQAEPWPEGDGPRRAGVSSFGIGGTNVHLVLEEAPPRPPASPSRPWHLLQLSAPTASGLERTTEALADHLQRHPDLSLPDVAFTLRQRRRFAHRRTLTCRDVDEAVHLLEGLDVDRVATRHQPAVDRPVIFMFPGQGAQHPGMGTDLYVAEPTFRRELDACLELFEADLAAELRELLTAAATGADEATRLAGTALAQPALFAVEHALARLWMSWGVAPRAMIGHSVGEYTAACLAGVMGRQEAARLVAERGRLMAELPRGSMLSVAQSESATAPLLGGNLALAAINGPSQITISGPDEEIDALERELGRRGVTARRLQTSHAFHSPMMDPILERFAARVREVRLAEPEIPFLSNLTGDWIRPEEATDPGYWVQHLRGTVRFADGIGRLLEEPHALFLEVGPGRTLRTATRWHPAKRPDQLVETSMPHPREPKFGQDVLLATLGHLWMAGVEIDWQSFRGDERRQRVPLPPYPFERRRYWIDRIAPEPSQASRPALADGRKKPNPSDWFYVPVWRETPVPPPAPRAVAGRSVLVLDATEGDAAGGLCEALADRLAAAGARVSVAVGAERFAGGEEVEGGLARYELPLDEAAAYERLLEAQPGGLDLVIHAALSGGEPAEAAPEEERLRTSFYRPLHLARALTARPWRQGLDVFFLTDALADIGGGGTLPERATLLGPARVLPREHPSIRARAIDIDVPDRAPARDLLLDALVAEAARPSGERTVALRGARRFIEAYEPLPLTGGEEERPPLRRRGVYLVTGGLGGVGSAVAEWLAREARARLVLVGRTALPERERWAEIAATPGSSDPVAERVRLLLRLEELGAEVLPLAADVTDPGAVAGAVARARERFGAIHGAVHAAGIPGGSLIRSYDPERPDEASAVLAPKVQGARHLAEALDGEPLEFLLLFSSLAGVVGRLGQTAYGAANAFLDAFARYWKAQTGVPTTSVDWGEWHGVGMAALAEAAARGAAAPADDGAPEEETGHPLLGRRQVLPSGEEIYRSEFAVDTHWVLDEHRLVGYPVVPGVAYAEMVHAALGKRAEGRLVEIEDLLFVGPLRVRDGQSRAVTLTLTPREGGFRFVVESPADAEEGGDGSPRVYALGRVSLADPEALPTIYPQAIWNRLTGREKVFTEEDRESDLGPRWQSPRRIRIGENEAITLLELPEEFSGDLDTFGYHPSLMDRAAGVAKDHLVEAGYLPLSYGRLRIHSRVPRRVYSHARLDPSVDPTGETLTWNTTVCDSEGRVVAELLDFSQKRINDATAALKAYAVAPPTPAEPAPPGPAREQMSREEGIAALARLLRAVPAQPQVAVSVRDLTEEIATAGTGALERVVEEAGQVTTRSRPRHPRPELDTPYRAPAAEPERQAASVWEELLGIDGLGVDDDFFSLGGDSVQAIQIIARLNELGWELTPQEFFQEATVAALAKRLGPDAKERDAAGAPARRPPLVRVSREAALPASFGQERLWLMDRMAPGSAAYNLPFALRLAGRFDVPALAAALSGVVARHEALRTRFAEGERGPVQVIEPARPVPLPVADLSAAGAEGEARRLARAEAGRPFNLARGPLVRALLVRLAPRDHVLVVTMHHVVSDDWSVGVLVRDLAALYRGETLPELPVQYADYAVWQRSWLTGKVLDRELDWWREVLAGAPQVLELPTDRPRPPVQSDRGATLPVALPSALARALRTLARERGATLFMVLLAGFDLLLSRWSGQDEMLVGSPVANRTPVETEGLVGFFVNALVLRGDLRGAPSFLELLERVRSASLAAYAHQEVPFDKLVDGLEGERDPSRSPLFQAAFILQNAPRGVLDLPGLDVSFPAIGTRAAKFDLSLSLTDLDGAVEGEIEYCTDLFDETTVRRHLDLFRRLLEGAAADPETPVAALPLLSPAEHHQLLREWNDTVRSDALDAPVHQVIREWAAVAPDAAAVAMADEIWTYGALAARVDRVARALQQMGAEPEETVGVFMDRSPDLVMAVLAILEAGSAFIPLDPAYPRDRLDFMVDDSRAVLLITRESMRTAVPPGTRSVCTIEELEGRPTTADDPAARPSHEPDRLAYVIYTSGSTGRPKGVEICHRGLTNLQRMQIEFFGLGPGDVVLQFASPSFDAAVWELLLPLSAGGCLLVPAPEERLPGPDLASCLARHRVLLATLPPSAVDMLSGEALPDLGTLVVAGEVCPAQVVDEWAPGRRFYNAYGPTEGTVDTTVGRCRPAAGPPGLGRPIRNATALIADRRGALLPAGVPGELCIGGALLARGYRRRPALTAESFVPRPHSDHPGERLYRTGDLARLRDDGELEFLGRIDGQIKIHGHRIETGEVAAALRDHPGVGDTAVVARPSRAGRSVLVAYFVPQGTVPESAALREHLQERLPRYMIPVAFVSLDELPRSPSGKLDARALPAPDLSTGSGAAQFAPPRNRLEQALAEIWRDELGLSRVGIDETFFDLGGDSLVAVRVVERMRRELDESLTVVSFFLRPTIRGLAELMAAKDEPTAGADESSTRGARRRQLVQRRRRGTRRASSIEN